MANPATRGYRSHGTTGSSMNQPRHILIGVAGGSASGKTLVAHRLAQEIGSKKVVVIAQDSYYRALHHLPFEERAAFNFDHPDAFDIELLLDHMRRLLRGEPVEVPIYDYVTCSRKVETVTVKDQSIVILEGILIFYFEELRKLMDIKVFVDTPDDIRLLRRVRRDMAERGWTLEGVLSIYEQNVRPMHISFVEPSKRHADLIIPHGGQNPIAVDILRTKIRALLRSHDEAGAAGAR